ncbi:hypothetical protein J1N10_11445 [Carboxylicivirga sp. A043]|uniref:hypothetical protein n=1 Tax=Carboxylicivirga litoralis TaxID=2816963 RepID=UPI0021CAEC4F|nr:hypothetical protein [Carboxylicivirga sp. A043]MCU4156592.1 hypothetical protein [Carboxylicivirga sp. A043]
MKKILILVISIVAIISCSKDDNDKTARVMIRLSNVSQYNFQNIIVNTSTGRVNFNNLTSGQKTPYKDFEKAYSYAFVELEINGKTYTIQPIDWDTESLSANRYYTYQIDANDSQNQYTRLSLSLIEE